MINAIIFDMDGLLIDSEPFWEQAEVEIFNKYGITITPEMTKQTMGLRVDEVVQYWFSRYPWESPPQQEIQTEILTRVIELVKTNGQPKKGVDQILNLFREEKLPIAIASSSPMELIEATLSRLGIKDSLSAISSAEHEPYGKPHPGVYISAAKKLNVSPDECLAFEDSPNGVLSAKSAKMKCVAVPDQKMKDDKRFHIADLKLDSLKQFTLENLESLNR